MTIPKASELLPCPVCHRTYIKNHPAMSGRGGFTSVPRVEEIMPDVEGNPNEWRAICYGCHTQNTGWPSREMALAAWNTRANTRKPQPNERTCQWVKVGSQWFDTSCGMKDESEKDRKVYCGGCGGKIIVKKEWK